MDISLKRKKVNYQTKKKNNKFILTESNENVNNKRNKIKKSTI